MAKITHNANAKTPVVDAEREMPALGTGYPPNAATAVAIANEFSTPQACNCRNAVRAGANCGGF
jgi:hypothetical protein